MFALRRLGYNPYHAGEMNRDTANNSLVYWHEAIDAKFNARGRRYEPTDFDKMLWRYDVRRQVGLLTADTKNAKAVTDTPCCLFADELLAAYPKAKVVINTRPTIEGWVTSMEHSFYDFIFWKRLRFLEIVDRVSD